MKGVREGGVKHNCQAWDLGNGLSERTIEREHRGGGLIFRVKDGFRFCHVNFPVSVGKPKEEV